MVKKFGHYAFIAGVVIALLGGLMPQTHVSMWWTWALVALGLLVGILNITATETQEFLIASVALVIASSSATAVNHIFWPMYVIQMLGNVVTFVFPAALVVALKAIWTLAQD